MRPGCEPVFHDHREAPVPALFEAYPVLRERIAWIPLADLPTPVAKMHGLDGRSTIRTSG
jgi:hypothetical protein